MDFSTVLLEPDQEKLLDSLLQAQESLPRQEQRDFEYKPAMTRKGARPRAFLEKVLDEGSATSVNGELIRRKEDLPWNLDHDMVFHPGFPKGHIDVYQSDIDALMLPKLIQFRNEALFFITPLGINYVRHMRGKSDQIKEGQIPLSQKPSPQWRAGDFSFVSNSDMQKILERDYTELQNLDPKTAAKSVLVLSGGIIEGLLFDALVASGKWDFDKACQNFLKDMIGPAQSRGIIREDRLTDALRKYRNLIHPGREIKEKMVFHEPDAVLAKSAVDVIIREVREWCESDRRQRRLRGFLTKLSPEERDFLLLFGTPKPSDPNAFEHPRLKHGVYDAMPGLVERGILLKVIDEGLLPYQERVQLAPSATSLVEELVIAGKVQRSSILLDWKNIDASGRGGGGAPPQKR